MRGGISGIEEISTSRERGERKLVVIYFADVVRLQCCFSSVSDVDELLQPLAMAIKTISTTCNVILFASTPDDLLTLQSFWWNLRQEMAQHMLSHVRFVQSVPANINVAFEILSRATVTVTFHKIGSALSAAAGVPFLQLACDFASVEFADSLGLPDNTLAAYESGNVRAIANVITAMLMDTRVRERQQRAMVLGKLMHLLRLTNEIHEVVERLHTGWRE
jgi:polysaccharide pyruvyl transferase WcaK-like protein